ncbi:MAG: sortase [Candidatus Pacebacteria bacterium]|nr:sortase [Candidatus Paceibacterota bacterium]
MISKIIQIGKRPKVKILAKFFLILFLLFVLLLNYEYLDKAVNYLNYRVLTVEFKFKSHLPSFLSDTPDKNAAGELKGNLLIPKIGVRAPIVSSGNDSDTNPLRLKPYLDNGVLFYPGSVLPREKGQTIILGHSAPAGWPKINYDTVFSELNRLVAGDEIRIETAAGGVYVYKVVEKVFLQRGDDVPDFTLTNRINVLVLISCWPPGKDYKRIAVAAVLSE